MKWSTDGLSLLTESILVAYATARSLMTIDLRVPIVFTFRLPRVLGRAHVQASYKDGCYGSGLSSTESVNSPRMSSNLDSTTHKVGSIYHAGEGGGLSRSTPWRRGSDRVRFRTWQVDLTRSSAKVAYFTCHGDGKDVGREGEEEK